MFRLFLAKRAGKVWAIVSLCLIVLMLVVTILASTVFFDLIGSFLGRSVPIYEDGIASMYPATQSASKDEAFANANAKNIEICSEGFVLLKNEQNALPLASGAKISVFGKNSVDLSYGGSGSSGFTGIDYKTMDDSLTEAGFQTNAALRKFYEDDRASGAGRSSNSSDLDSGDNEVITVGETPQSMYTQQVKDSYKKFGDAAIVVITRIGGEGFDLPRYQGDTEGAVSEDSHYLELDQNEIDLLTAVTDGSFGKVIVVFNIPSAFEAAFLEDTAYASFADKIDAAVWTGFAGGEGIMALGKILNGEVSPSGRLVDTWAADFSKDPTFVNFGTGPSPAFSDKYTNGQYYFVDYEEGVYVGYRYYETRALTDGEDWYAENVVYPFGYGLSYTQFAWEVGQPSTSEIKKDGTIEIDVTVTNTGAVAGKEVVQLYCTPPYYEGGIEKAAKVLCGFAKTGELQPNESETVTLFFDPYYAASYDYRDANGNSFCGYELESGDYILSVAHNAHETEKAFECSLYEDIRYSEDPVSQNTVENRYTGAEGYTDSDYQLSTVLSRSDWEGTWPDAPTASEMTLSDDMLDELLDESPNDPNDLSGEAMPDFDMEGTLTIRDLLPGSSPEPSPQPIIAYDDPAWEELLDRCSVEELEKLINEGCYSTQAIEGIGLPATQHGDGPAGFTYFLNKDAVFGTCHYCSEPVMAATFNEELMEELGNTIGEEGYWGNDKTGQPYSSIYAPGVNIHRSMFGGRNAEYFSEDPLLSGKMAAAEIRGCQEMGVICMVKHFAANEQETHRARNGDVSWLTEQALREIYLRSFEIAVKEGESRGLMTSFNRIGLKWTGGDYRLITEILRDEWGFQGTVICDFNTHPEYMFSRQMAYAGGDLNLANTPVAWVDPTDVGDLVVLRRCAKNVIYSLANSNAMNGEVIGYRMPDWQIIVLVVDAAILLGVIAWGAVGLMQAKKREE